MPGLLRKNNYGERFDRLMDCATWIFNKLLTRAANTPRNFIIDQTNVYKNARIRKLRPFANYHKVSCKREKAMLGFLYGSTGLDHKVSNVTYSLMQQTAVVVFPTPSELKSRAAKRFDEMGKEVPAEAVNEMTGTWTYTHYFSLK